MKLYKLNLYFRALEIKFKNIKNIYKLYNKLFNNFKVKSKIKIKNFKNSYSGKINKQIYIYRFKD